VNHLVHVRYFQARAFGLFDGKPIAGGPAQCED
jgi:hypothetical protein